MPEIKLSTIFLVFFPHIQPFFLAGDHKENITEGDRSVSEGETASDQQPDDSSSGASASNTASPESKGAEGEVSEVDKSKPKRCVLILLYIIFPFRYSI